MFVLEFFDPRTLFACECMLAIVFAIVFIGMNRAYPQVRGIRLIALSFLLAIPNTALFALRGLIPRLLSITLGNLLALATLIAMYEAILQFTGGRNFRWVLWATTCAAVGVIFFYSEVRSDIVPRIIAVALAMMIIRLFTAAALLGGVSRSPQRTTLRLFALVMGVLAVASLYRAVMTYHFGAPSDLLRPNAIQTPDLVLGLLYLAVAGLFFLILSSNELVLRTRLEAHLDPLSQTFNRRGLEVNLELELDRVRQWGRLLSIALVDIDHFKAINDSEGHAAGDAAIRDVALTLSSGLRGSDHVGRFGGDEFLLIFPQTGAAEAMVVAERFAGEIAGLKGTRDGPSLTVSVGITEAVEGDTTATLIARADKALYGAKSDGRNCRRILLAEVTPTVDEALA